MNRPVPHALPAGPAPSRSHELHPLQDSLVGGASGSARSRIPRSGKPGAPSPLRILWSQAQLVHRLQEAVGAGAPGSRRNASVARRSRVPNSPDLVAPEPEWESMRDGPIQGWLLGSEAAPGPRGEYAAIRPRLRPGPFPVICLGSLDFGHTSRHRLACAWRYVVACRLTHPPKATQRGQAIHFRCKAIWRHMAICQSGNLATTRGQASTHDRRVGSQAQPNRSLSQRCAGCNLGRTSSS